MLRAENLTKRYEDGLLALDHLNLEVPPGEVFCLLGANGAGKTTTINLFLGFIEPTEGSAYINGLDVTKEPLNTKRFASYVAEDVMLYTNLSVMQNLDFFARLGGKKSEDKSAYQQVLNKVGLGQNVHTQKVKNLSKGMRQKLGIAIALIKDTPAILLDEPTSGLDPKVANELLGLLRELKSQERAIFMSTHDVFRAKAIADRVGIMRDGQLVAIKTSDELKGADLERIYIEYMEA